MNANTLHPMLPRRATLQNRTFCLNGNRDHRWIMLLQIPRNSGEGSARSDTGDKPIHQAFHLIPNLNCRRVMVKLRIRLIRKLPCHKSARNRIAATAFAAE